MFILRSAFWLGLAAIVLVPREWDADADVKAAGKLALETGKVALVQSVNAIECTHIECAGGKALLLATGLNANPLKASPMQDSKAQFQAPVPQPRLKRAG